MDMGKERITTEGCKRLLDAFQFVGISRRNRIPNSRDVFKLGYNEGKIIYTRMYIYIYIYSYIRPSMEEKKMLL
jgi:hypothetical protein